MDDNLSVAKGVFVHKNGFVANKKPSSSKKKRKHSKCETFLVEELQDQACYKSYKKLWTKISQQITEIMDENNSQVLKNLQDFLSDSDRKICQDLFPVAVLLTGINQPDHYGQFEAISQKICENNQIRSTILKSRDASSLKNAIENLVAGFLIDDQEDSDEVKPKIKKGNLIMRALRDWYYEKYSNEDENINLVLIIPDFELFNKDVLRDLVLTISYYRKQIPLVLIFGVATTINALENALPLQFTSKAKFNVFKSQPSVQNLNRIIEDVLLNPINNFQPSGRVLQLLTEIFLFYDFSITGFIQGFKYCLLEHFSKGNIYSLCDFYKVSSESLMEIEAEDLEEIRSLMSMRIYIESRENPTLIVSLVCEDDYLISHIKSELLPGVYKFIRGFYLALNCLYDLMHDLPKLSFGKHFREFYCAVNQDPKFCESKDLSDGLNLLTFSTKHEFITKVESIICRLESHVNNHSKTSDQLKLVLDGVKRYHGLLKEATTETVIPEADNSSNLKFASRHELKEKLMEMTKQQHSQRSQYQNLVTEFLEFLRIEFFSKFLISFEKGPPLIELFVYSDASNLRKHIVGAPRAALHQALQNPHHYLQCECCELESLNQLRPSQPDLAIVYKIHLECSKLINLFDWLQAFNAVVADQDDDADEDTQRAVDPLILARFTRAVSELQFLGFIKSTKRKTDHVTRLTW